MGEVIARIDNHGQRAGFKRRLESRGETRASDTAAQHRYPPGNPIT
jgi:hypothetical protein